MQEVNIYIATTAKGPARRKTAHYIYTIEWADGRIPKTGSGRMKNCTENQLELNCLIRTIRQVEENSSVRVFTQCEHIINTMNNHWLYQWEKNNWKKAGDKPVKYAELWQQLSKLLYRYSLTFTNEAHKYSMWQEFELKKLKEKYDEK